MNNVIKDRMDKIGQGIVPEGYKETKIGIIPEDWEVKKLNEISKIVSGGTPSTTNPDYWDGEIAWATPTDITGNGKFINDTSRRITDKGLKSSSANLLPINSILMTSRATIGERSINSVPMATNQGFKSFICKDNSNYEYLYYLLEILKKKIIRMSSGSTFLEISKKDIDIIEFAKPPLKEQEKIADILSTWDKAIVNIEKLIKEKEIQKTGLMQQLLTGETRLPGFTEEWKEVKLVDVLDYEQPDKYITNDFSSEKTKDKMIPVLTANKAFILGYTDEMEGLYEDNPVIIFDDFTTDNKYVDFKFKIRSSAIKILKNKENINLKFVFERMQLIKHPMGGHKRYYISEYQFIKFKIPSLKEQKAIAEILSTADKEIELLKQLLANKKEEKKGLMQLLLTGIVRV